MSSPKNTILHIPLSNESIALLHQNGTGNADSYKAYTQDDTYCSLVDDTESSTVMASYPPDETINPSEYAKLLGDKIRERQENLEKRTSDISGVISSSFNVADTSVRFIHEYSMMREFEWRNRQERLPEKTSVCCWWDTKKFDTQPVCIPIKHTSTQGIDTFHVIGCFCSFKCAKAYIKHGENTVLSGVNVSVYNTMPLLKLMYDTCYKNNSNSNQHLPAFQDIPLAPPRQALVCFGGVLNIETFRGVIDTFNITMTPIISVIPKLIQTYTTDTPGDPAKVGSGTAQFAHIPGSFDNDYRLRRCTPKKNSNNVLSSYFSKLKQ